MKTKTIPFDLETAKKIQSGEIEGRIMYNGKNGGEEVIILSYDNKKYQDYSIRFAYVNYDEIDYLFDTSSFYIELPEEAPITFHTDIPKGHAEIHGDSISFVNEEIPKLDDITTREGFHNAFSKHKFKPFDRVLVRNKSNQRWHPDFYATTDGLLYYTIDCKNWEQCIPYEGNEHLVGTTDKPK